jgi:hypothetical protein
VPVLRTLPDFNWRGLGLLLASNTEGSRTPRRRESTVAPALVAFPTACRTQTGAFATLARCGERSASR